MLEDSMASFQANLVAAPLATPISLLKTLILEPNPALLSALVGLCRTRAHEVIPAGETLEALEVLRRERVDLVLLRLSAGVAVELATFISSLAELRPLREMHLIALIDGDQPPQALEEWLRMGFDDFITTSDQQSLGQLSARLAVAEAQFAKLERIRRDRLTHSAAVAKYEELFRRSPEALLLATVQDGYIIEANAAAESLLGQARGELQDKYLSLVLPEVFDRHDFEPLGLSLYETMHLPEICLHRAEGAKVWIEGHVTLLAWPPTQAILLALHDLRLPKQREQQRVITARQEASGYVLQGIAREMNDSLTSVAGNIELLSRMPAHRMEIRELLDATLKGLRHVEDLHRRSSKLGRLQTGVEIKKRPLVLHALIEKTVSFALLGGKSRPVLHLSKDLWPVEVDEVLLAEALQQLVVNADQAMPQGGSLFVEARNIRASKQGHESPASVCLRLRDQGPGIDPENRQRVFDPFFSTKGADGMGLAYAAAVIRAHGGRLEIESTAQEGCTIAVHLPVNVRLILEGAASPEAVLPPLTPHRPTNKARVLFMDDDAQIRDLVAKILTTHGFDVYLTKNGQEAMDAYRKAKEFGAPFDVILMDLDVRGGMGGIEATSRLRAEYPHLKALLTTGYVDDGLLESHRDHGFAGVILKPFQVERLVGTISKLVGLETA